MRASSWRQENMIINYDYYKETLYNILIFSY